MQRNMLMAFIASGFMFSPMAGVASAQTALSSCDPLTGLTPAGAQCVTLRENDPTRFDTPIQGEGASNFRPVDVQRLAKTYQCDTSDPLEAARGTGGVILLEDCGTPLDIDPSTLQEFVGYAGNPAPTPVPANFTTPLPPAQAPVQPLLAAPQPPVVPTAPPLPSVAPPPVGQIAGASLAGAPAGFVPLLGIAAPFLATAGAAGAVAAAAAAGGGSSTPSTN